MAIIGGIPHFQTYPNCTVLDLQPRVSGSFPQPPAACYPKLTGGDATLVFGHAACTRARLAETFSASKREGHFQFI